MGVPLLPDELTGVELLVEVAWGADPAAAETSGYTWTDITTDVRFASPITAKRGRAEEAGTSQPAECTMTLDNASAAYSLGPKSPNYPNVRRNTPVRVRTRGLADFLALPGLDSSYAISAADPALQFAGDHDIRVDVEPDTWRPADPYVLAMQLGTEAERIWTLRLLRDGRLEFGWTDAANGIRWIMASDATVPDALGRLAVRATLDVDNGAGGSFVTFYTAPDIGGPWTQLGSTMLHPDVTEVVDTIATGMILGRREFSGSEGAWTGRYYAAEKRNGIDGTVVAQPDFTTADPTADTFTDAAGLQWEIRGAASLTSSVLFYGYATSFTPAWNLPATDATVTLTAAGSLRRLGQRDKPVQSALRRDLSNAAGVVRYWPLEDGERARLFRSGLANDPSYLHPVGDVDFASFDGFAASAPLPVLNTGAIVGRVPYYDWGNDQGTVMLIAVPEDGAHGTENRRLLRVSTAFGPVVQWNVDVSPGGALRVTGFSRDDVELFNSGFAGFDVNGKLGILALWLEHDFPNGQTKWVLVFNEVGADVGAFIENTEITLFERITQVDVGQLADMGGTSVGHVAIINEGLNESVFWSTVQQSLVAWAGETATARIARLGAEYGVPVTVTGDSSVGMGPQPRDTILTLLRECETADQGVLYDGEGVGLSYLARDQRENSDTTVTVDVAAGDLAPDFEPADDDQRLVNSVTASQTDGASVTVTDVDGPLGTAAVDVYDHEVDVNVAAAGILRDYAAWFVHLGTVEGYRYPAIPADLRATPHHAPDWVRVRPSSRVDLAGPDAVFPQLPADDIRLLAEGVEVEISPYAWRVVAQCSPFDPWRVIVLADDAGEGAGEYVAHLDTVASELTAAATVDATSLTVATLAGPVWTTDPSAFPFGIDVAGTRVTVTGVTGATSPQTFTIDPAPTDFPAGASVRVHSPPVLGI